MRVQAFCCDCGHLWWSTHPAARRYARRIRDRLRDEFETELFASWDQVEDFEEWAALTDECRRMLHVHHERAARAAAERRVSQVLDRTESPLPRARNVREITDS